MTYTRAIEVVRAFVSQWTDQKLAEVLAFAEDGYMDYYKPCRCLIGVASSDVLHVARCGERHYHAYHHAHPGCREVEIAYSTLGMQAEIDLDQSFFDSLLHGCDAYQFARDKAFIRILREVIAERELIAGKPNDAPEPGDKPEEDKPVEQPEEELVPA